MSLHNINNVCKTLSMYSYNLNTILINYIKSNKKHDLSTITNILYTNPLPYQIYMYYPIHPLSLTSPITHIPLVTSVDGIITKAIIWKPGSLIEEHTHENMHCFFTPLTPKMYETRFTCDNHRKEENIQPYKYMYIHDKHGSHMMKNKNNIVGLTFHMYIPNDIVAENKCHTVAEIRS